MPRYLLIKAREKAGLTQSALAEKVGAERKAVNYWEAGTTSPRGIYRKRLPEVLKPVLKEVLTPEENDLFKNYPKRKPSDICPQLDTNQQMSPPCQSEPNHDIVESSDLHPFTILGSDKELSLMDKLRRAINNAIGTTLVGINLQIITAPFIPSESYAGLHIDPEEHLEESKIIVKECWNLVNTWQLDRAKAFLNADRRILTKLATTPFSRQGMAASLAFEAEIMQVAIATHELDYAAREEHCAEAVRFGKLSGNWDIVTIAHNWQGNTYTYCYYRPKKAIRIFNNALSDLNREERIQEISPLSRSDLYIQLAIAHAQDGNEAEALKYIALARMAMPDNPQLDPFYRCIRTGSAELDEFEGRTRLFLAKHLPKSNHAETAHEIFKKSIDKHPRRGNLGKALTRRADAARAMGDMEGCVKDLTDGLIIAVEIKSLKQMSEVDDVLGRVLPEWKQEKSVQKLQKEVAHAIKERSPSIVIAHR